VKRSVPILVIDYRTIGTVSLDELKQAFWEDIEALKDHFGVAYVTNTKLILPVTNEFGDPLLVKRLATGAVVSRLDTHHYRPACIDYKL
jgi:hypothetical protein